MALAHHFVNRHGGGAKDFQDDIQAGIVIDDRRTRRCRRRHQRQFECPFRPARRDKRCAAQQRSELRDEIASHIGRPLLELSMGMSNDFEVAIEEGATQIRLGRALFGERSKVA